MEDLQSAVEALLDLHPGPGQVPGQGPGDVNHLAREAHGVVQGHHPVELEAEELVQLPGPCPPGRLGILGGHGELQVVAGQVLGQDSVGLLQGGHAMQPKLAHEPVLECAPEALNPAFGLRRASQDQLHLELLQQPAHLGQLAPARELLLQARLRLAGLHKNPMSV